VIFIFSKIARATKSLSPVYSLPSVSMI
jgi:hypothetical protein